MNYSLAKTDPGTYSINDFQGERLTVWDGVTTPQAVRAIREIGPGDRVLVAKLTSEAIACKFTSVFDRLIARRLRVPWTKDSRNNGQVWNLPFDDNDGFGGLAVAPSLVKTRLAIYRCVAFRGALSKRK
jgi:hypothetical protein